MKKYNHPNLEVLPLEAEAMMLELSRNKTVRGEADMASQERYFSNESDWDDEAEY